MRRRVAVGRRGPGLLGTMARTAVVAGTATVVAKGVSGSMDQKAAQQQAAAQQQQQAAYDAGVQQAQLQAQQEALAQQQQQQIFARHRPLRRRQVPRLPLALDRPQTPRSGNCSNWPNCKIRAY